MKSISKMTIKELKAYIKENCVSCCSMCNIMKNKFSKDDFINQCKKIAKQFENY